MLNSRVVAVLQFSRLIPHNKWSQYMKTMIDTAVGVRILISGRTARKNSLIKKLFSTVSGPSNTE
jgi:hypothetical protein